MRIFTASLATETNTFSPIPTGWGAFEEFGVQRGSLRPSFATGPALMWEELAKRDGHEIVHGVVAYAAPAGPTVRGVYEALRDEILRDAVEKGPFDVVLLALHGAMVSDGYADCEGDLMARLREALGGRPRIGAELDLHCHLTQAMIDNSDILVAFKEYPHVDIAERARELYQLALAAAEGRIRPAPAVFDTRMVSVFFTTSAPMRAFVDRMSAQEGKDGVLSISLAHGFPWGDVQDNGAKVLVYTDGDTVGANRIARELGEEFWRLRDSVAFNGMSIDMALDRAELAPPGLVVIADAADNTGGGAPGDSTFVLRRMLERGVRDAALGPLWDPVAVTFCRDAGVGAQLDLRIGGKCGPMSGAPLDLRVTVKGVLSDLETVAYTDELVSYGAAVLVEIERAGVHVVLCSRRMQAFGPQPFTKLGLDLDSQRIVVVKSYNHFQAGFRPIAARILHIEGPGAIDGNMAAIPFKHRSLNYWPRVADPFCAVTAR
jgi:microcystin degradation protein MlrC